jgi:hypothetical protein
MSRWPSSPTAMNSEVLKMRPASLASRRLASATGAKWVGGAVWPTLPPASALMSDTVNTARLLTVTTTGSALSGISWKRPDICSATCSARRTAVAAFR